MNINIYLALKILSIKSQKVTSFLSLRDIFKTRTLHKSPTQSDEMSLQKSDESIPKDEVKIKYFSLS